MPAVTPFAEPLEKLRREVERALNRHRSAPKDRGAMQSLLADLDALLIDNESVLGQTLAASIAGGYFDGADNSLGKLPPILGRMIGNGGANEPPDISGFLTAGAGDDEPPKVILTALQEAAERMSQRRVMDSEDFYRLDADAKSRAFTITADLTDEARRKLHEGIVIGLDQGPSFTDFKAYALEEFGKLPIAETHLEQVFRNATNESFAQGQEHVLNHPMVADEFPYRLYSAINDARARREHLALNTLGLNGTAVYHKNDPTWLRFRPPWDWGCRCGFVALTVKDAARRGVEEAIEWLASGIEPEHTWVAPPPFAPNPKWDRLSIGV